jgi:hypothetical protein
MRSVTLGQVRELLSSAPASAFFEAWARADSDRAHAEEKLDDLASQILTAESRAGAAEKASVQASDLAEQQRHRLSAAGDAAVRSFIETEVGALEEVARLRAVRSLEEAKDRRQRARALDRQAEQFRLQLEQALSVRGELRIGAATLGGYVGDACLFFGDAEHPGGAFVVPLLPLLIEDVELTAFVLYRLGPLAPLSDAIAVRDTVLMNTSQLVSDVSEEADPFTPPPEHVPSKSRKKERS